MHATSLKHAIDTTLDTSRLATATGAQRTGQSASPTIARTRIHPERVAVKTFAIPREEALRQAILRTG